MIRGSTVSPRIGGVHERMGVSGRYPVGGFDT